MRRKPNSLVAFEQSILDAATRMEKQGIKEFYGFQMAKELGDYKKSRSLVGYGTLYRALDRLVKMGYLERWWEDTPEENRPRRRYYRRTSK